MREIPKAEQLRWRERFSNYVLQALGHIAHQSSAWPAEPSPIMQRDLAIAEIEYYANNPPD